MGEAKNILKKQVRKLRANAERKRYEATKLDDQADKVEETINQLKE